MLRLAKCRRRVDRHEFIAAADQEIAGVKVTVKEHGAFWRTLAAPDRIGKRDDFILKREQ